LIAWSSVSVLHYLESLLLAKPTRPLAIGTILFS
jgi:hypothetical protein